jgi:hypothetical protein
MQSIVAMFEAHDLFAHNRLTTLLALTDKLTKARSSHAGSANSASSQSCDDHHDLEKNFRRQQCRRVFHQHICSEDHLDKARGGLCHRAHLHAKSCANIELHNLDQHHDKILSELRIFLSARLEASIKQHRKIHSLFTLHHSSRPSVRHSAVTSLVMNTAYASPLASASES